MAGGGTRSGSTAHPQGGVHWLADTRRGAKVALSVGGGIMSVRSGSMGRTTAVRQVAARPFGSLCPALLEGEFSPPWQTWRANPLLGAVHMGGGGGASGGGPESRAERAEPDYAPVERCRWGIEGAEPLVSLAGVARSVATKGRLAGWPAGRLAGLDTLRCSEPARRACSNSRPAAA